MVEAMTKTHDGETILFSDVNFTVNRGDKLVIVGPNGSGASLASGLQARVYELGSTS